MTIDWITVAAQFVNFLVLIYLLKRFLYRPILDGIDARENEIALRMSEASQVQQSAESLQARYQKQIEALDAQRSAAIDQAREEAQSTQQALLHDARKRLRAEQQAMEHRLMQQAADYVDDLHARSASSLLSVLRKALADLSDEHFEERLVMHALSSLQQRTPEELTTTDISSASPTVTTHEPLSKEAQRRIQSAAETVWPGTALRFLSDEKQAPGVLLQAGSSQVEWTIDSYVSALERQCHEELRGAHHKLSCNDPAGHE